MNDLTVVGIESICKLVLMLAAGVIADRAGVLTKDGSARLSDLLVYIIAPLNIFSGFLSDKSDELSLGMLHSLLLGLAFYGFAIIAGAVFASNKRDEVAAVDKISIAFVNLGMVALPIVMTMFGNIGVVYISMHRLLFQFLFYTYGVMILGNKFSLKDLLNALVSPQVICAVLGLAVYISGLKLPEILTSSVSAIGNCTTPLGMILCGSIVSRSAIRPVIRNVHTYIVAFLRLILLPVCIMICGIVFDMDSTVVLVAAIVAGSPVGTFVVIYAERYHNHPDYASGVFGLTTLTCMVTIPVLVYVYTLITAV